MDPIRYVGCRLDAMRRTVFVHIPHRGSASIGEHRELIALIDNQTSFNEIEAAVRAHKLKTVESFRTWWREHEPVPG